MSVDGMDTSGRGISHRRKVGRKTWITRMADGRLSCTMREWDPRSLSCSINGLDQIGRLRLMFRITGTQWMALVPFLRIFEKLHTFVTTSTNVDDCVFDVLADMRHLEHVEFGDDTDLISGPMSTACTRMLCANWNIRKISPPVDMRQPAFDLRPWLKSHPFAGGPWHRWREMFRIIPTARMIASVARQRGLGASVEVDILYEWVRGRAILRMLPCSRDYWGPLLARLVARVHGKPIYRPRGNAWHEDLFGETVPTHYADTVSYMDSVPEPYEVDEVNEVADSGVCGDGMDASTVSTASEPMPTPVPMSAALVTETGRQPIFRMASTSKFQEIVARIATKPLRFPGHVSVPVPIPVPAPVPAPVVVPEPAPVPVPVPEPVPASDAMVATDAPERPSINYSIATMLGVDPKKSVAVIYGGPMNRFLFSTCGAFDLEVRFNYDGAEQRVRIRTTGRLASSIGEGNMYTVRWLMCHNVLQADLHMEGPLAIKSVHIGILADEMVCVSACMLGPDDGCPWMGNLVKPVRIGTDSDKLVIRPGMSVAVVQ